MSISLRIKIGRRRLGLTEQEFANRCGVSRGAVQHWEAGLTAPKRANQERVAKVLELTVSQLMNENPADLMESPDSAGIEATLECLASIAEKVPLEQRDALIALVTAMLKNPKDHKVFAQSLAPLVMGTKSRK